MKPPAIDAVVVPDFSGESPTVFEARTLFFLASWLEVFGENGPAAGVTLHLGCIGEPPGSVRRLAARAGAGVSVHVPMPGLFGGFANKLRGLEVGGAGERVLLLDADMLVLGGFEALMGIEADFAAAPAGKPRVPLGIWRLLYAALDLPFPTERIASVRGKLGLGLEAVVHPYEGQQDEAEAMLPYHNSGALLVRRGRGLREMWEDHLRRIAALSADNAALAPYHAVIFCDQAALATALQALRGQGCSFQGLPEAFNTRLVHLRGAALRWEEIRLFHATGFLRGLRDRNDLPTRLAQYADRWTEAINEARPTPGGTPNRPHALLQHLWQRWVQPAWEDG